MTERFDNLTRQLSSPEGSFEVLYNEALRLYDEVQTRKKRAPVSPSLPVDLGSKAIESEASESKDESLRELEDKGVKININLNGDGTSSLWKQIKRGFY